MRTRIALLVGMFCGGCAAGETFAPSAGGTDPPDSDPTPEIQISCPSTSPAVVQLSLSGDASYALLDDGTVWCWGHCLGKGSTKDVDTTTVPVRVNVDGVARIGAGNHHACAVLKDGTVRCWGWSDLGVVGVKPPAYVPITKPYNVDIAAVADIGAGQLQTCALRRDGSVACWGLPRAFLPTDEPVPPDVPDPNEPHPKPVEITGIEGADALSVGHYMTCVHIPDGTLLSTATLRCFGGLPMPDLSGEKAPSRFFAASKHDVCLIDLAGKARCHGSDLPPPELDSAAPAWDGAVELAVSDYTVLGCARMADGRVRCLNQNGQYGFPGIQTWLQIPDSLDPLPGIYDATHMAVSDAHGCVIDGRCVRCWGYNGEGQLGDGTYRTSEVPTFVKWQ